MTTVHTPSGDVFESGCDMIDVTSNNRPDTNWKEIDANGHVHQWYVDGKPATGYRPGARHETPTLAWVKDGVGYYPDGSEYDIGHYECAECRAPVRSPGMKPDMNTVYMPGLRWYTINGQHVSPDEFKRRYEEARGSSS